MNTMRLRSKGTPEIIVAEAVVLLGIEHLQHRGGRVALNAGAKLVDLVQHHDAVPGAGLADRLDDVAGQSADIGSPMAADLGFVMHAAEAHADKFAVHGARDRLAERGLADAGRPDEAKDRRLAVRRQLAHRQIFDDPALDLLEAEVILVEDAARRRDVDRRLLGERPWQVHEPVEIGPHHPVLARGFRHPLQPPELLARLIVDFLGHVRVGDRLFEFGDLGGLSLVRFAELALYRRHLLAQQDLTIAGVERRPGFPAYLLRQPENLDPMREKSRDPLHSRADIHRLEDVLLLVRRRVHEGRDHVGERAGRIDVLDCRQQFVGRLRQELNRLDRLAFQKEETRFDLVRRRRGFGNPFRHGDEEWPAVQIIEDPEPAARPGR